MPFTALRTALSRTRPRASTNSATVWKCAFSTFPHNITPFTNVPPSSKEPLHDGKFDQADHPSLWEQEKGQEQHKHIRTAKVMGDIVETSAHPHHLSEWTSDKANIGQYSKKWEPALLDEPNLEQGELASGANVVRTRVWKEDNQPAIMSISKFAPDNFRAAGYAENAPMPDSINNDKLPDFREYRLKPGHADRRPFAYFVSAGYFFITASMVRTIICKTVHSLWMAKDITASGSIEINLKPINVGEQIVVKWRGKPIFVKHRSQAQIERARKEDSDLNKMKDPELDADRCPQPEWLVCIGVCTHLGCIPTDGGNYDAYFCPCHGSHYDCSGRIRIGPAPTNLEIPPYIFKDSSTIVLGS